jgi:hypothetical protein
MNPIGTDRSRFATFGTGFCRFCRVNVDRNQRSRWKDRHLLQANKKQRPRRFRTGMHPRLAPCQNETFKRGMENLNPVDLRPNPHPSLSRSRAQGKSKYRSTVPSVHMVYTQLAVWRSAGQKIICHGVFLDSSAKHHLLFIQLLFVDP